MRVQSSRRPRIAVLARSLLRTKHVSRLVPIGLALALLACKPRETSVPTSLSQQLSAEIVLQPPPDHLRGRVALHAGARLYAAPHFGAASWLLTLPDPPLVDGGDSPPRARALRVIGVTGEFVALTNDLSGEGPEIAACGEPLHDIDHLRLLVYVPEVHLASVTTRVLELEPLGDAGTLRVGAGARVGEPIPSAGLPSIPQGSKWRMIDADGLRALVPVPDDAIGRAWDPAQVPEFDRAGEQLFQDAEGVHTWLDDQGSDRVELTLRNACAEQRRTIDDAKEIASLRALAEDLFYDQGPEPDPLPEPPPAGPYRISVGADLRWTDGNLAAEVIGRFELLELGQASDDRRCFALTLGSELQPMVEPPLACARAEAIELLDGEAALAFERSSELEVGGTIRFGELRGDVEWDHRVARELLNVRHSTIAECLRPLANRAEREEVPALGRWELGLTIDGDGRVIDATVEATRTSEDPLEGAVADCLRAEAGTWLFPSAAGRLVVPIEFGDPDLLGEWVSEGEAESEPEPAKGKSKGKAKNEPKVDPNRGSVVIIRDDESKAGAERAPDEDEGSESEESTNEEEINYLDPFD